MSTDALRAQLGLYWVTDGHGLEEAQWLQQVEEAVLGGVTCVQLRSKHASTRDLVRQGQALKTVLRRHNVPLVINDRLDVALAVEADGLHLGQGDLLPADARRCLPPHVWLGWSIDHACQLLDALLQPVDYLWPLLMVVLAPVFLPGMALRAVHLMAALLGFAGAAVVILGGAGTANLGGWAWGYVPAFPTAAIGGFALVSGLLSLLCHALLEPATALSLTDALLIGVMGLGPMGAAFFLWDKALKLGDARHIGILSYLTPLASTALLVSVSGRPFTAHIALAAAMIVGAALLGTRQR
jgi:hypothetical protein